MLDFIDPLLGNVWCLIALLVVGFVLLVKGADWLVDGASGMAKRLNISDLIIGLTVVAFGTSMPEFVVNIISAAHGNSELAITNVLGSNTINIFVVLGLTAVVCPVTSDVTTRKVDIPVAFVGALLVLLFACSSWPASLSWEDLSAASHWNVDSSDFLSRLEGILLVVIFFMYLLNLGQRAKKTNELTESFSPMKIWKGVLLILVGLFGLTVGGELIVKSATQVAHNFGVSDAIIGLTIVALGTSLPELATSVIAAAKKNADLALGNCVGSCIFNVFFVISISATIHPLQAYPGLTLDALMAFAGPALVWLFVMTGKRHRVNRLEGGVLLLVYGVYLTYLLMHV